MMSPLVSIVLPTYNDELTIESTVRSVLNQSYPYFELIIVDDCSTDGTFEIARAISKADQRVQMHRTEKNSGGPATPRNVGLGAARGKYVAFIDADDLWMVDKLKCQIVCCESRGFNFISTNFSQMDECGNRIPRNAFDSFAMQFYARNCIDVLVAKNFVVNSSALILRDLLSGLWFDEDPDMVAMEDWLFWLEIMAISETRYVFLNKNYVVYRVRSNSIVERKNKLLNAARRNYCLAKFIRKHPEICSKKTYQLICILKGIKNLIV